MADRLKIVIVAGEASGDTHAAKVVRELREAAAGREVDFFGAAGPKMRAAGVEPVVRSDDLAVVGLTEIAGQLPVFLRAFRALKQAAAAERPDVAVLVDFPEFNLRLARSLKKLDIPVVYYISPQLWAWRKGRLAIVKRYVDLMLTILPFEQEWYARNGFEKVQYVGSPLAREVQAKRTRQEFCDDHGLESGMPIVALLPGSRAKEISRVLPVMIETAADLGNMRADVQFVVAVASERDVHAVKAAFDASAPIAGEMRVVADETYDALNAADAAAITSGTATLEAGILGTPMVVVYRTSGVNYRLFEPMIDVEHYGLINLIAGKRVAKELIQQELTASNLADELLRLLAPEVNRKMRQELHEAAGKLGHGGASKRAAEAILRSLER